jgi:hypothetical protein
LIVGRNLVAGPARPALSFGRAPRRGGLATGPSDPASRHHGPAATLASQPSVPDQSGSGAEFVTNSQPTEFIPFPYPLRSDAICFQLEIEPRSSLRPIRVDGFSPINRWPWRRNLPCIESNPRTRSKRRGHQIRRLPKQLDWVGS